MPVFIEMAFDGSLRIVGPGTGHYKVMRALQYATELVHGVDIDNEGRVVAIPMPGVSPEAVEIFVNICIAELVKAGEVQLDGDVNPATYS